MKLLLFALTGIFVFGAVDWPRVAEARRQWETIRQEVAAGLVPAAKPKRLNELSMMRRTTPCSTKPFTERFG